MMSDYLMYVTISTNICSKSKTMKRHMKTHQPKLVVAETSL